jgi:hypothetical protein
MTHEAPTSILAVASALAVAGFAVGLAYFAMLRRTVSLYGSGNRRLAPAALTIGRIAGAAAFLLLAARLGPLPLLATYLGFLLARGLALRAARRTG